MGNDSGALILLIVLVVSAFLLIVIKLTQFAIRFGREKRYLLTKMIRAADYNEYRYWRRKLCCLYLRLIPFVNERNAVRVYPVYSSTGQSTQQRKNARTVLCTSSLPQCLLSASALSAFAV